MGKMNRIQQRKQRHKRLRRKIMGTAEKPRLAFCKSNRHLYAQIIDDVAEKTMCFVTTNTQEVKNTFSKKKNFSNKEAAQLLGKKIAEESLKNKIQSVTFDRGGNIYHGVVKDFADSAREAGLKF